MKRLASSTMRDVAKRAAKHGWTWNITGRGHVRFSGPTGGVVFCAATPSDRRAIREIEQDFRRQGVLL